MAKLTRYLQKIFANNSDQIGVFGTGVDKETSKNVETLQSADYEDGWSSAIITNKNYPIWQEMDGVQYGLSYQLKYLFQNGIPEWISTETYYTNSFCRVGSNIYYSLQDDNINHNPALNDGWWTLLLDSKADVDLSNINDAGKIEIAKNAMPSDTFIPLTIGAANTVYTAPANGYVSFGALMQLAGGALQLSNESTGLSSLTRAVASNTGVSIYIPVGKDQRFKIYYDGTISSADLRFIYAVGSESEAS